MRLIKSKVINPIDLSLFEKISAIIGLNLFVDYCHKHHVYYETSEFDFECIYVCPLCYEEACKGVKHVGNIRMSPHS